MSHNPSIVFELYRGFLIARHPAGADGVAREIDGKKFLSDEQAAAHVGEDVELLRDLHAHCFDEGNAGGIAAAAESAEPQPSSEIVEADPVFAGDDALMRRWRGDAGLRKKHQHLADEYFEEFLHACRIGGIDPWSSGLNPEVEPDQRSGRRRLVIIASINLMRAKAAAHPRYLGQRGPLFQRSDGSWVDSWTAQEPPLAAKVGVALAGNAEPVWAVATWKSYAAYRDTKDGPVLFDMWAARPDVCLASCAEGAALRRALGDILAFIYSAEEMMQRRNPRRTVEGRVLPAAGVESDRSPVGGARSLARMGVGVPVASDYTGLRIVPEDPREPVVALDWSPPQSD